VIKLPNPIPLADGETEKENASHFPVERPEQDAKGRLASEAG